MEDTDDFGIPLHLSSQLDNSVVSRVRRLTESYRSGRIDFSEFRRRSDAVIAEGKIKDLLIDADVLVPELISLSPDDAKNFKLKERKNVSKKNTKKYSV